MDFSVNMAGSGMDNALAALAEAFSQQLLVNHTIATYEVINEKFIPVGTVLSTLASPACEPYAKTIDNGRGQSVTV